MKQIICKEIGNDECGFVATGQDEEGVKNKMWEHHKAAHTDAMTNISELGKMDLRAKMNDVIRDTEEVV